MYQKTLRKLISYIGTEVYGGCKVNTEISPTEPNTGIIFELPKGDLPAKLEYATPSRFSILLKKGQALLLYSEHMLATLYAMGIDNARIKLTRIPSRSFKILQDFGLATDIQVVPYTKNLEQDLCNAIIETGLESQNKPRKILRLTQKIDDGKLFLRKQEKGLTIKAITDYPGIGVQEREMDITPENYIEISTTRGYCKYLNSWIPEEVYRRVLGAIIFPQFGLYSGVSTQTNFVGTRSPEKWRERERVPAELAGHTIIDKLGTFELLLGKFEGVHATCKFSNHKTDLELFKANQDKFILEEDEE